MRRLLSISAFFWAIGAFGQQISSRPDAMIVVKEDATTAEMVEISMLKPDVPKAVMQQIVARLGEELKMTPRGFPYYTERFGNRPQDQFVKARIAVAGLIDRQAGLVVLQPLARAFAGLPAAYQVRTIQVTFEQEIPNQRTIKSLANDSVVVDGSVISNPVGLQYLIALRTQDPSLITIPVAHQEKPLEKAPTPASPSRIPPLFWALIAIASACAGWLVYLAFTSRTAKKVE